MAADNTAANSSASPRPTPPVANGQIGATVFQQMLTILDDLTDHTHTVYDDYTSVCQCNCNCSRGIV
jgi:hypothetical protein